MSDADALDHVCQDGCLRIRLRNDDILRKMEPTIRLISDLIDAKRPKVTLIDFREIPVPTTFMDKYQLGELAGRYLPGRLVATLVRPDQADRNYIGKMVAINRGALIEVFTDPAAAEVWLQQQTATGRSA